MPADVTPPVTLTTITSAWGTSVAADLTELWSLFGTIAAARNLDGDTGQFAHLTVVNDGTATTTWPDRIRVNYNNGTRTRRTFHLDEFGQVRAIPAATNTTAVRVYTEEFSADGVRDPNIPLIDIQNNTDDQVRLFSVDGTGDVFTAGSLDVAGSLNVTAQALALALEAITLEWDDPAPSIGVWLRKAP